LKCRERVKSILAFQKYIDKRKLRRNPMNKEMIVVIGAYGSGKSEYAINLARMKNEQNEDVILVDMDVVNPYFRSRDVREKFDKVGIEVIAPEGEFSHADLPMLSPKIRSAILNKEKTVILDVGGDPAGCRTLGRFHRIIAERGYRMIQVVNTKRPFTSNQEEIIRMKEDMEYTSKLKVTEFVCNTNLMEYTTEEVVEEGVNIVHKTAEATEVKFDVYLVLDKHSEKVSDKLVGKNKVILDYFLNKPWEQPKIMKVI
jgi:ABC-type cobalamin/Fe3+-siderophores transport system ATPase subunit